MNKIEIALHLAKDCTYADEMTEGAKKHLRDIIDEALMEVKNNIVLSDVMCSNTGGKCDKCGKEQNQYLIKCIANSK